jgi:predicted glycosyltransferase
MRIWYDACTGKQVRYAVAIAKRLRKLGHDVILTTREHPDTLPLARYLKEDFKVIGKYDPSSLSTRLQESAQRILEMSRLFQSHAPDLAIAHQSVELCRVAFGLNIPIVLTADTPYADAVNRLTIPLADTLIVSEAIPKRFFKNLGVKRIVQFKGVDEVAWMKDFVPSKKFDFDKPLIVLREMETKAAYAIDKTDLTETLARKLTSLGNVLLLPRYDSQERKRILVMKEFTDSLNLIAYADLIVNMGGTMAREAALRGTPSIVISTFTGSHVNQYVAKKGFPLFIVDSSEVMDYAKKYIGRKWDVKEKLNELENPVDIISDLVQEKTSKMAKNKKNINNF